MVIKIRGTALIFVYLPDEGKRHYEFMKELKSVEFILDNTIQKSMEPYIFGDLNVDFSRKNSKNVKLFNKFLSKFSMLPYDMVHEKGKKVTRYKGKEQSWIDHVIAKESNNNILKVKILDDQYTIDQNSSDHHPIEFTIKLSVDDNHKNKRINFKKCVDTEKIVCRWNMAKFVDYFVEEFKKYDDEIDFWISKLEMAKTKNENKTIMDEILEFIHLKLYNSARNASIRISKLIKIKKIKVEGWWSSELKALNMEMRRYLALYRKYGNKCDQISSDIYQKRFRILHRAEIQRNNYRNNVKLDKLKNNNINSFWKRIKQKLQKKTKVQVDIETLKDEFMKIFNDKLIKSDDTVYVNRVDEFKKENINIIYKEEITVDTIENVIKDLKVGKAIGINKCSNEMFKYNRNKKFMHLLAKFYTTTINYGLLPDNFNISIIKPLVKDSKKSPNDQNNIRPISISDTICTILEKLLLIEINNKYTDDKKQFGFKKNSSCQHALFVLNEALNSNKRRNLKTYVCAIDASKAFDKVNRNKLWCKLMDKVDAKLVRILMEYYKDSFANVCNEEEVSEIFRTTIGVKQGGCLSPRLFTIYIDEVIKAIEQLKFGVEIGKIKVDILLYADDILLITDDKLKLKYMLNVLTTFGEDNEIKFNGSKTTLLVYNKTKNDYTKRANEIDKNIKLKLSGEEIVSTQSMKYLGCIYSDNYSLSKHWDQKSSTLASKMTQLNEIGLQSQGLSSKTKAFLFKTFIRPLVNYGVDTFCLNKNDMKRISELEGNCLKDSLGLYRRIFSTELFLALDLNTTKNNIIKSKLKLYLRLMSNDYTNEIIRNVIIDSKSFIIENSLLNEIHGLIGTLYDEDVCLNVDNFLDSLRLDEHTKKQTEIIWELRNELNQVYLDHNKIEKILQSYEEKEYEYIDIFSETHL